ncbi:hypothetical protein [Isoalcanivorax beigongshangi]|uniref:Uncharacterized protein n=1 Tax=Isoalcanivorax beigongshangi TaxID=3238810 RepID=A0ABV4AFF3_9GAMM
MTNFTTAQANWELRNLTPPEAPAAFLDTREGQRWLEDSISDLCAGEDVTWRHHCGRKAGVTFEQLFHEAETDCGKGAELVSEIARQWTTRREVSASLEKRWHECLANEARALLSPLADDYAAYLLAEEQFERQMELKA